MNGFALDSLYLLLISDEAADHVLRLLIRTRDLDRVEWHYLFIIDHRSAAATTGFAALQTRRQQATHRRTGLTLAWEQASRRCSPDRQGFLALPSLQNSVVAIDRQLHGATRHPDDASTAPMYKVVKDTPCSLQDWLAAHQMHLPPELVVARRLLDANGPGDCLAMQVTHGEDFSGPARHRHMHSCPVTADDADEQLPTRDSCT